jgi:hypothetical protein
MTGSPIEEEAFDPLEPTSEELLGEWRLLVQRFGVEAACERFYVIALGIREEYRKNITSPFPISASEFRVRCESMQRFYWDDERLRALCREILYTSSTFRPVLSYNTCVIEDCRRGGQSIQIPHPLCVEDVFIPDVWADGIVLSIVRENILNTLGVHLQIDHRKRKEGAPHPLPYAYAEALAERGMVLLPESHESLTLYAQWGRHGYRPILPRDFAECMRVLAHDDVVDFLWKWRDAWRTMGYLSSQEPFYRETDVTELTVGLDAIDPLWRARWTHPVWRERWVLQVTGHGRQDLAWPVREGS